MIMMMGMISKALDDNGKGTVILSDGNITEFTTKEWVDTQFESAMGQRVLYKKDQNGTQIRVITNEEAEELKNNPVIEESEEEVQEEDAPSHGFTNVEECIESYKASGFSVATDREVNGTRTISMRYYENGEFGEASISVNGSKIDIKETRNGKPV